MLLRSRPDTVHRVPSRETQTSTSLSGGSPADCRPLRNITPAIADCRFKVPLPPRLHGLLFYMINECLSSMLLFLLHKIPHDFIPLCYRLCASAFFFIFLASLSSLKNCFINWLHSEWNLYILLSDSYTRQPLLVYGTGQLHLHTSDMALMSHTMYILPDASHQAFCLLS